MELDMTQEKKPSKKKLLPEGERFFEIVGCSDEVKSRKGNNQYILRFKDEETSYEEDVYAVSEPGKRWFLKEVLDACGIPHENGVYKFNPPLSDSIIGKRVKGFVEHEDSEWINRQGETVKTKQHRIVSVEMASWDGE